MYFRDGPMSNIYSYTKVKPHCEYDACITKCTIFAKFFSYPLNYSALYFTNQCQFYVNKPFVYIMDSFTALVFFFTLCNGTMDI